MGRKGILALAFVALLGIGCGPIAKLLPILTDIILATQDATLYVDRAEQLAKSWFAAHPNPTQEKQVAQVIGATRNSLIAAERVAHGASELTEEDYGTAFNDFRVAWTKLVAVFRACGIGGEAFGAAPGEPIEQLLGTPIALEPPPPE